MKARRFPAWATPVAWAAFVTLAIALALLLESLG